MTSKDKICFWPVSDPQINHWSRWDCSGNVCLSWFFFFFLSLSWWHCTKPHYTVYVVRESYNLQVFRGLFLESPNNLPSSRDYSCQIISYRPWCRVFAQTCQCVTWNEKKGKIPFKKMIPRPLCSQNGKLPGLSPNGRQILFQVSACSSGSRSLQEGKYHSYLKAVYTYYASLSKRTRTFVYWKLV